LTKTYRPYPATRSGLIFKIVCVYYLTLLGLVACAAHVVRSMKGGILPVHWEAILVFFYYLAPILIAFIFGILFRPFWNNFRNLLMSIFLIHLLWSVSIAGWRQMRLNERYELAAESFLAAVDAEDFKHRFFDNDEDGLVDEIVLWGRLNIRELPPGRYIIRPVLSQSGNPISDGIVDRLGFRRTNKEKLDVRFGFDPRKYGRVFERPVDIDLYVYRLFEVTEEDNRLLRLSRWVPFLRRTSWQGQDRDFVLDLIRVETVYGVDTVELLVL